MRIIRSATGLPVRLLSSALSYTLLITLIAPFHARTAHATTVTAASHDAAPVSSPAAVSAAAQDAPPHAPRRDGELIIRFRENLSEQQKNDLVRAKGGRRTGKLRGASRVERVELPPGQDPAMLAAELKLQPEVEIVEPNFLITHAQTSPNDARFSEQWALNNTGQTGGQPGADISARAAWVTSTGSPTTVIAIIDSGVDFTHPDLRRNQWTNDAERDNNRDDDRNDLVDDLHGWDWTTDSGQIRDEQGHGTAIAGIIAAEGNNQQGTSGVMWRAALMSLRVLNNTGTGDIADAVEAIDYAVAHGAQVINCSWGTEGASIVLRDAITRAASANVVVVTSAGNGGRVITSAPY